MFTPFNDLPSHARVWIYQADRLLDDTQVSVLENAGREFAETWTAHQQALLAGVAVLQHLFLVIGLDESASGASGCSIDASAKFVREMGRRLDVNFLDRMSVAVKDGKSLRIVKGADLSGMVESGSVTSHAVTFNNLVGTKGQMETEWEVPVKESWVFDR